MIIDLSTCLHLGKGGLFCDAAQRELRALGDHVHAHRVARRGYELDVQFPTA